MVGEAGEVKEIMISRLSSMLRKPLLERRRPPRKAEAQFKSDAYLVQVLGFGHQEEADRGEEQGGQEGQLCVGVTLGRKEMCACERVGVV